MPKLSLEDAVKFVETLISVFPVAGFKVGFGDFNENGVPDVILEVFLNAGMPPLSFVIDVPALDLGDAIKAIAGIVG